MSQTTPRKIPVAVRADHKLDGSVRPIRFRAEEGESVHIDRIIDVRPAAVLKAGGQGIRYTCMVEGKQLYLFDCDGMWFLEEVRP